MPNDTRLVRGDPAHNRYILLVAALGGEPNEPQYRATLARLAAWTTRDDIDTLCHLIREATGRRTARLRMLIVELGEILGGLAYALNADVTVTLPSGLVGRVVEEALRRDREGGEH